LGGLLERTLRSSTRLARTWSAAGRDLFYPPACASCRRDLPASFESRFCDDCRNLFVPVIADRCQRCSAPVGPHLDTSAGCVHCSRERWKFDRVFSLGPYADALRDACLRMKRAGTEPLAAALGEELFRQWCETLLSAKYDLIVPVPHHWRQRVWRTQLVPVTLGRVLSQAIGVPLSQHLVRKAKFTRQQSTLSVTERRANLRGAFRAVPGRRIAGGRVLVVDDVLTTGTTSDRVARVLRELGASSIDVAVVARGLGHS
jgi:predicted amidophosphoribosyltransferase